MAIDGSAGDQFLMHNITSKPPHAYNMAEHHSATNTSLASSTTSGSDYLAYHEFWLASTEHTLYMFLKGYAPPALILLGTMINALALAVLRHHWARSSAAWYLGVFTSVSTAVLYLGCGLEWVAHVSGTLPVSHVHDALCKLYQCVFSAVLYSRTWLLVLLLTDRLVLVAWPLNARSVCCVFTAKLLTAAVFVGLFTVSIHSLWTYELLDHYGCNIDPAQHDFQTRVWPWIAAAVYSYIPHVLILGLVILLAVSACCTAQSASDSSGTLQASTSTAVSSSSSSSMPPSRFVRLTIVVSVVYLLLSLPTIVVNFIQYANPPWLNTYLSYARFTVVAELFNIFSVFNCGACQLLFFACSSVLRKDLYSLCRYRCKRRYVNASTNCNFDIPNIIRMNNNSHKILQSSSGETTSV